MEGLVHYIAVIALCALLVRLFLVRWWVTEVGRHLTALIGSLAAAFVLWSGSLVFGSPPLWAWVVVLVLIAGAVTWRLVLQVRAVRRQS